MLTRTRHPLSWNLTLKAPSDMMVVLRDLPTNFPGQLQDLYRILHLS